MPRHKPFARGVSQLMYVGDDTAIPASNHAMPSNTEFAAGAVSLLVAMKSRGIVRLAAAAVAGWVGYNAYQAYRARPVATAAAVPPPGS